MTTVPVLYYRDPLVYQCAVNAALGHPYALCKTTTFQPTPLNPTGDPLSGPTLSGITARTHTYFVQCLRLSANGALQPTPLVPNNQINPEYIVPIPDQYMEDTETLYESPYNEENGTPLMMTFSQIVHYAALCEFNSATGFSQYQHPENGTCLVDQAYSDAAPLPLCGPCNLALHAQTILLSLLPNLPGTEHIAALFRASIEYRLAIRTEATTVSLSGRCTPRTPCHSPPPPNMGFPPIK